MQKSTRLIGAIVFFMVLASSVTFGQRMMRSPEERAKTLKDSLSLTDDQTAKVVKIYQEMDQQRKDLFESGSSDRQERMNSMRALNDSTDQKIEGLLTSVQKAKYEDLKKLRQQRGPGFRRRD